MKTATISLFTFISLAFGLFINSCNKNDKGKNCKEYHVSSSSKSSHHLGKNCMECHTYGGEGEGCFNVAGSLFEIETETPTKIGYIEFFTEKGAKGEMKYKVYVDNSGNFYSTDIGDVTHLYAKFTGESDETHIMKAPLTSGACNSCHGVTTSKIGLK